METVSTKPNGGDRKVTAVVQIELDDKGEIHVSCPRDKMLSLGMLFDAMKVVSMFPNPQQEKPLIVTPRLIVGGKETHRVS